MNVVIYNLLCMHSDEGRARIVKFACEHGSKSACSVFEKAWLSVEPFICTFHEEVLLEASSDEELTTLPPRKCGRPVLLGDLEQQLQLYLHKIRELGGIVTASVVVAAASCPTQLAEFGGHSSLTSSWAYHLLDCLSL